jgi:exodeoxyribonuclease V beta subunit
MSAQAPVILDAPTTWQIDLDGIKLIEASAGTGKTYTIANLYLRHILAGREPGELLVVTFTNAATEELRGRIRARLHDALLLLQQPTASNDEFLTLLLSQWQSLEPETQRLQMRRLQLALRCMDEAAIDTIHAYCQRALTDHAFHSGQSFEVRLLDDDRLLWEEALKDWWRRQSYTLGSTDWHLFKTCLNDLPALLKWQAQIRSNHTHILLPQVSEDLSAQFRAWREREQVMQALASQWKKQRDKILETLQQSPALSRAATTPYHPDKLPGLIEQWDHYFDSDQLLEMPTSLEYLSSAFLVEKSTPAKRGSDLRLESGFFLAIQQTLEPIQRFQIRFRARALIEAHDFADQRVRLLKREGRTLAYQDQLTLLLEALQGASGEALGQSLRTRFPVAMIDEFQDTDAIQYGIFHLLYFDQDHTSLIMIGDPKQAIYSFRGGDIFTYMKAKSEASVQHYSLQTNWRSEAALIQALNALFGRREAPFIYAGAIDFVPALPAPKDDKAPLLIDNSATVPLTIWRIPLDEQQKPLSKARAHSMLHEATANEIARLIQGGIEGTVKLGKKPLCSADIAVLVRTSYEGNALRSVLSEKGVRAVTIGRERVFDSEEANGLLVLLQAINHHSDRQLLRNALASSLLRLDYLAIAAVVDDEVAWQEWLEKINGLHLLWQDNGFIVMFQHLLQELKIGEKLAATDQADRRLTNLLHIAELLQQQSRVSAGLDALLGWYQDQISQVSTEEAELRLESDEALVKIVTIHSSKGLEYPVVFIPYLWECKPVDLSGDSPLRFHDPDGNLVVDLGSADFSQHGYSAERERLAEDIRLAYVAITRARSKVYLAWGDAGVGGMKGPPSKTALAYLLHPRQSAGDLGDQFPQAFSRPASLDDDLVSLQASAEGSIAVIALPQESDFEPGKSRKQPEAPLEVARFSARPAATWRIASFSSLTQDIHQVAHGGSKSSGDPILDFPAGSHVGLLLHSLLEHLDFQQDIQAQCRELLPGIAQRYGFASTEHRATISNWMEILVRSPLNDGDLTLSRLSGEQRLNELSFDFGLDHLHISQLNDWFVRPGGHQVEPIGGHDFRGLITGVIDLVFEYQGKYYLADYKSNYLGGRIDDYSPDRLRRAMTDRRYDLQYLLYSVALHRYLAKRIPDYRYDQHFGGVYYLFLRALRPQYGPDYGVFFDLPEWSELKSLDRLLRSTPFMGAKT